MGVRGRWPAWVVFGIAFCVAALLVFVLPWYFPPAERIAGPSYELGFNNRLAMAGLVFAIAVGTALAAVRSSFTQSLDWLRKDIAFLPRYEQARGEYTLLALLGILLFAATLLLNELLVNPYWGEASYFLSRIDLAAMGFRPYVDFHHNYGPLLLYLPVWLQRLSVGLLGLEDAYALSVAFGYVLGLVGQFVLLRALELPPKVRWVVLACTVLPWTTMSLGLNYVPLRFTAVPCCIVVLHVMAPRLVPAAVAAALASAFCLGLSPEMGLAMVVATWAYAGALALGKQRRKALVLAAAAAVAPLPYLAFSPKYLSSLGAFARGTNNFPIYPNLHNLLFVAVCLGVLPPLLVALWKQRNDPRAPLAAAFCAAGVWLIGPAFGRCDPGHVVINSLIPVSLMFAAMASWGGKRFWAWCAIQAVAAGLLMQISFWNHYTGHYRNALEQLTVYRDNPEVVAQWRQQWQQLAERVAPNRRLAWSKAVPFPAEFATLVQERSVALPFASPSDTGFDRVLKLQPRFRPAYHPIPMLEIASPRDVDRVVADALARELIILPAGARATANQEIDLEAYTTMLSHWLSELMLFPVETKAQREPFMFEREVYRRLFAECEFVGGAEGALLLKPKSRGQAP